MAQMCAKQVMVGFGAVFGVLQDCGSVSLCSKHGVTLRSLCALALLPHTSARGSTTLGSTLDRKQSLSLHAFPLECVKYIYNMQIQPIPLFWHCSTRADNRTSASLSNPSTARSPVACTNLNPIETS